MKQPLDNASPNASQVGIKRNVIWQEQGRQASWLSEGQILSLAQYVLLYVFKDIWRTWFSMCHPTVQTLLKTRGRRNRPKPLASSVSCCAASLILPTKAGTADKTQPHPFCAIEYFVKKTLGVWIRNMHNNNFIATRNMHNYCRNF